MSTVTRPRGPLPPRVYWTRRLLVVAVAFGLVFGIAHLLGGGGVGDGPSARPVGAEATTSSTSRASTVAVSPSVTAPTPNLGGSPSATPNTATPNTTTPNKASPTALATPSGTCANADVVATPSVRGTGYAGRSVLFDVTLTTKVSPACTWTVSANSLVVKVTSGADRIWSTQECTGGVLRQSVVVRKDQPVAVAVAWNGQRSDSDCTRTTTWVEAGYYHVVAAAFGADPIDEQFRLANPVPATRTVTATPTPDVTKSPAPTKTRKPASRQR